MIATVGIVATLLALLACGVWVGMALLTLGWGALLLLTDSPAGQVVATTIWSSGASWTLAALPLFIWMGEILFRSGLSEGLFRGLAPWIEWLPGRLMHVNIIGCGLFAAVSGSSAATAATVGSMSLPELFRRGYNARMAIGSLAGGGSLGLLIPPSIAMIVYGVAAGVSVTRLFIAAIVPSLIVVSLFSGYVILWALINPRQTPKTQSMLTWRERFLALRLLLPVPLLVFAVIGTIYAGVATATEAAAFGVVGALLIAVALGNLTWNSFVDGLMGAARTSCMIGFILVGAAALTSAAAFLGIPRELAVWVGGMELTRYEFIAVLLVLYLFLGCFLDGISIIVLTAALILPLVAANGIDLIWFGIFVTLVVEMSQITPPVGFNLYVLQGLTGRSMAEIAYATTPFFLLLILTVAILTVFPEMVSML